MISQAYITVSTQLDAHLSSARNPMFGPKVVIKYDVTQLESWLSISPIPLFALDLAGDALCVYACGYSTTWTIYRMHADTHINAVNNSWSF